MKNIINVVGAIIINENNEIFCAQRPLNKKFGGLWEFPGGKIEKNETLKTALERELLEELNLKVEANHIFMKVEKEYDDFIINLTCLTCKIMDFNSFNLNEHIAYKWEKKENLLELEWVPTDIPIVKKLQTFL